MYHVQGLRIPCENHADGRLAGLCHRRILMLAATRQVCRQFVGCDQRGDQVQGALNIRM